tara:strand:+ start:175 stop:369 length:195 start_codon:yes stop_codon:yes gene_type:complete
MTKKFDYIRNPVQIDEFIKKHGKDIKDKNIIYGVQTNHKSDRRNTKIGKSERIRRCVKWEIKTV